MIGVIKVAPHSNIRILILICPLAGHRVFEFFFHGIWLYKSECDC